jgi:hypothetical protein
MKNTEHVRLNPDGTYICRACDDFYKPNLPAPITMVEVMMAEWMRLHENCMDKKQEEWKIQRASAISAKISP